MPDPLKEALVVVPKIGELPTCAGLTTVQRWEKMFYSLGVERVRTVTLEDLPGILADLSGLVVVAAGEYANDLLSVDFLLDTVPGRQDGDVFYILSKTSEPGPVLVVNADSFQEKEAAALGRFLYHPEERENILQDLGSTVKIIPLERKSAFWSHVSDTDSARQAEWGMLKALQFRPGGLIAKYLNRPISIRFSRHLVNSPVTPNMTTIFAFFVGAAGIAFVFAGGWLNTVIGGLLLQINSVLDGIDGELARIRLQQSKFGAYLDSVCDEVLNAMLFAAIGYNLYSASGNELYLAAGIFAGVMAFTYALIDWHCNIRHGLGFYWWFEAYKPRKKVQRSTSPFAYFKKLFWKESYLFLFLIFGLLNWISLLLFASVISGAIVFVLLVIHIGIKRARW
ncbi:MAG: CDP-alcohol phosphatidyltransferase family protein [Deltaproteobacteria bacterium]|nr:CDP-alcohol phosphatidyltransferase family protein [Deltaproteobacteria bacterium]